MESIICNDKECFVCHTTLGLHKHHVFGGANRKHSEKYGLTIWLCGMHHNLSKDGIHSNRPLELVIKRLAQEKFESIYSHDLFMQIIGKNYK